MCNLFDLERGIAMSKGSKIVPVRIPDRLFSAIVDAMEAANRTRFEEPYVLSTYVRKCLVDKLDHLQRSKKRARKSEGKGGKP